MNEAPEIPFRVTIDGNGVAQPSRERSDRTSKRTVTRKSISIKVTPNSDYTARQGREAWTELHNYPGCCPHWFSLWRRTMIPRNCGCVEDFAKILDTYPPNFDSPDDFFIWGVLVHNRVNEKLIAGGDTSKRIVSLQEARETWHRPEPA